MKMMQVVHLQFPSIFWIQWVDYDNYVPSPTPLLKAMLFIFEITSNNSLISAKTRIVYDQMESALAQ